MRAAHGGGAAARRRCLQLAVAKNRRARPREKDAPFVVRQDHYRMIARFLPARSCRRISAASL